MKVKSKKYFYFTVFFAKIYSLLTHVRKTPPLRSHKKLVITNVNMPSKTVDPIVIVVICTTITITVVKEIQLAKIGSRKSVMSHDVLRS